MLLRQKELYIGVAGFLFFVVGYYVLREHYNPGYIKTVWENELGGRYTSSIEGHDSYPLIYYDWLQTQFSYWYLWVLPGVLFGIFSDKKWLKDLTIFTALVTAIYFLILSSAKTAVFWYSLPAYPFLSVFVAIFIYTIFRALAETGISKKIFPYNILPYVFILVIFFTPYKVIKNIVLALRQALPAEAYTENMELLLQDVLHNTLNIDGYTIADLRHDQHIGWYYKVFGYQHRPITQKDQEELIPNTMVLAFRPESKKFIEDHFNAEIVHTYYNSVIAYKLGSRK